MSNPYVQGPISDHFDGTRFFNPGQESTDRGVGDMLRWKLFGRSSPWPARPPPDATTRPAPHVDGLAVTMVGHASLLIQACGRNILVDPVWSDRASPVRFAGPKRWDAPGIAFDKLPPVHAVLLTHNHYDHMDAATLARLHTGHAPRVIAPLGNDAVLARAVPGMVAETGDWGDRFDLGGNVAVTLHPAYHWSARTGRDRRMALWCGFVLTTPRGTIYLAGDTGYGDGAPFRLVRDRFGAPDLAILPIGAYEPRWFMRNQHVNPAEAVQIFRDCGARHALGVHWGTFRLTDEPRLAPVEALAAACRAQGVDPTRFVAVRPGDTWAGDASPSPDERDHRCAPSPLGRGLG